MLRRNFAPLLILLAVLTTAAWAIDITGTWAGAISTPNGDFSLSYTFKQDGDKFTGTVTGPDGTALPLSDCKMDGDKISFAVKIDMGGNSVTFSSKGTVKADEITLTTTNDAGFDMGGDLKLKKQASK